MKRNPAVRSSKMDSYEHVLMCLICRSLFDDHDHQPKFLPCHHTFCKDCLREFVRQMGDEIECPSCRKPATIPAAGVAALQTNFYAKYIQSLVYGVGGIGGSSSESGVVSESQCRRHETKKAQHFCRTCSASACEECLCEGGACSGHSRQSLAAAAEDFQAKIDSSFARANALIEQKKVELEARLKAFSEEKDRALLRIDAAFETHAHLLNRRATLLKNKVIDSYNERVSSFESDLEEISTAMTCVVSLKEFHETAIGRGQLADVEKGVEELNEVYTNVDTRIRPRAYHVLFEDRHGVEKFKSAVKDLGKVTCFAAASGPDPKTSSDDTQDPPDVTPSSPRLPGSGVFPRPPSEDDGDGGGGGGSEDNEGLGPNGGSFESAAIGASDSLKHLDVQQQRPENKTDNNANNNTCIYNNTSGGCNNDKGIFTFPFEHSQRPRSARVRKAFEKVKDVQSGEVIKNDAKTSSFFFSNNNNNAKILASPVRRPKRLVSPENEGSDVVQSLFNDLF